MASDLKVVSFVPAASTSSKCYECRQTIWKTFASFFKLDGFRHHWYPSLHLPQHVPTGFCPQLHVAASKVEDLNLIHSGLQPGSHFSQTCLAYTWLHLHNVVVIPQNSSSSPFHDWPKPGHVGGLGSKHLLLDTTPRHHSRLGLSNPNLGRGHKGLFPPCTSSLRSVHQMSS